MTAQGLQVEVERLQQENTRLRRWVGDAVIALRAATTIGEREGCHLNYGNHDRLLREASEWTTLNTSSTPIRS